MNLLLLEPAEVLDLRATVRGRRAAHLRDVLGVTPGSVVRVGLVGGPRGEATVLAVAPPEREDPRAVTRWAEQDDEDSPAAAAPGAAGHVTVDLALRWTEPPSAPMPVELVLAVPRPKVLTRVVEAAASFGVTRVHLVNAWRVDKAYLASPRLAPEALRAAARLGAEQGATSHVAEVVVHRRLMAYLDGLGSSDGSRGPRLCAHPRVATTVESVPLACATPSAPAVLAIGPEGGWIPREVDTFAARGFTLVALGTPILRVETAVAAALGQVALVLARE